MIPSITKRYGIWAAILVVMLTVERVQADPRVEKTIRDFFTAMAARDATGLNRVLGERFATISAGRLSAKVGFDEAKNWEGLLSRKGNDPSNLEISSVKVDISPTHRSVGIASFTLNIRFTRQQLADAEAELKENPQNAELRRLIADGGIQASMFAMLAGNYDGTWKIVCISLPS